LKQQNHYVYNFDKKKMNYSSIDCTHMENGPATAKDEVNWALNVAIVIVMPPLVIK
jgi:hypothetical protein